MTYFSKAFDQLNNLIMFQKFFIIWVPQRLTYFVLIISLVLISF